LYVGRDVGRRALSLTSKDSGKGSKSEGRNTLIAEVSGTIVTVIS
jgi:hypothetical protein